jgi:hypothetical protein
MKILTTSAAEQTIRIIPRSYPDEVSLILRDDSTNTETIYTIENLEWENNNDQWQLADYNWNETIGFFEEDGYLVINNEYNLVEGRYYDLTIKDGTVVIYKDKIFCTDQTIDQETDSYYTINESVYAQETSYDNDYIII